MSVADFFNLLGNGIWVIGAAFGVYYGIRGDIKDLRKDLAIMQRENEEAHKRHEADMQDYESRLRLLERIRG